MAPKSCEHLLIHNGTGLNRDVHAVEVGSQARCVLVKGVKAHHRCRWPLVLRGLYRGGGPDKGGLGRRLPATSRVVALVQQCRVVRGIHKDDLKL